MAPDADTTEGQGDGSPLSSDLDPEQLEPVPIPPPPPPGHQIQVALGMLLMQQSSFDRLPPDIQQGMIRLADQMDDRSFQYAQRSLDKDAELNRQEIEDRGKGRKQVLWALGSLATLGIVSGTTVTCVLIYNGQYALAHTVMMSGLAVLSALLGGAGLTAFLQKMTGGGKSS